MWLAIQGLPEGRDRQGAYRARVWLEATQIGAPGESQTRLSRVVAAHSAFSDLMAALPARWRARALSWAAGAQAHPSRDATLWAAKQLVQRLGWLDEELGVVPALQLTVKVGTELQLGDVRERRRELHAAFVQEAVGLQGVLQAEVAAELVGALRESMEWVWAIRWENERNEA